MWLAKAYEALDEDGPRQAGLRRNSRGTHRGAFQGIEATGRRVTISEFTFYRLKDGKFAEVWDFADMDAVMRQIRRG